MITTIKDFLLYESFKKNWIISIKDAIKWKAKNKETVMWLYRGSKNPNDAKENGFKDFTYLTNDPNVASKFGEVAKCICFIGNSKQVSYEDSISEYKLKSIQEQGYDSAHLELPTGWSYVIFDKNNIKLIDDSTNEDRNQLTIPFKEKPHKGKTVHEHLIDALIDLRTIKDYRNYFSNSNPDDEIDKALKNLFKKPEDIEHTEGILRDFIWQNTPFINNDDELYSHKISNDDKIWVDKFLLKIEEDITGSDKEDITADIYDSFNNGFYDIKTAFTKDGLKQYYEFMKNNMIEKIAPMEYTVYKSYKNNDSGLIDVWRTVEYLGVDGNDIYQEIVNTYEGVGVYWTWNKESAQSYWSEGGHSITLYGKVSIENVNWEESIIMNNGLSYTEENELRLKENGSVMIIGFHDDELDKYYDFETPYIVKTGQETR